ncbi:Testis-expressed protein 11 [Lamellibrachia satsuma]|nr:Testis-expressed protein 11 [Lamellibrachia satsuma]
MGVPKSLTKIRVLVKQVGKTVESESATETLTDQLLTVLRDLPCLDLSRPEHQAIQPQIESSAVALWNLAVAKKTSGKLGAQLNAKLRHISCSLVFLSCTKTGDANICRRQAIMSLKTARAWLDSNNPSMAESSLSVASESIEKLRRQLLDGATEGDVQESGALTQTKLDIEKDYFKLLSYKAEAACAQGQHECAVKLIQTATELLQSLPHESQFLAMLCYNFGVECFQSNKFEGAVTWLMNSFELGKRNDAVGHKNQARTLRLLAHTYLEWDSQQYWQKALNAIGLANAEHSHPAGLFLKIRILLQGEETDDTLRAGLEEVLRHAELTVDLAITTIRLVLQHKRADIGFDALSQLEMRFQHSPDLGKLIVMHLEALLQLKQLSAAKTLLQNYLADEARGSQSDMIVKKHIHLLLWEQAAHAFEEKDFGEALEWYDFSLGLFSCGECSTDTNMAKLHRNRALCQLGLQQLDKAEQAVSEAEKCDSSSGHTYFVKFKIALTRNNQQEAILALEKMSDCSLQTLDSKDVHCSSENIHGLICLAAQLAFEQSSRGVAMRALECLVRHSSDPQQVLTALRCLTRLRLTFIAENTDKRHDLDVIISYIKTALQKLTELVKKVSSISTNDCLQNEAAWFMKIAWNMALQCGDAYQEMNELFILCCKVAGMCEEDAASLVRQKTCLLMAAAASLKEAMGSRDETDKTDILRRSLQHIEDCHAICRKIRDLSMISDSEGHGMDHTATVLLVLYEFEAKARLGDVNLEAVLEKALLLPQVEPKAFETMAALAQEARPGCRGLSIRILKIAIKKHLQMLSVNYTQVSKAFHSLIELALQTGSSTDTGSREEAWGYYVDVTDIVQHRAQGSYPEMEVLWLMTKAWNCGINFYRSVYTHRIKFLTNLIMHRLN